ncbi:AAA family ATPase [Actinomadura sp. KC06]|uniref:uridine kinase family protein n=1 Tax=Actinomadura sp. KC06 TaxID=2530369 RepID=UPI001A9DB6FF|nr:AAA family ATPase [Actinomadura sp. KC06]
MSFPQGAALTYPALAARLLVLPPSCGVARVVAIDGPSGAGKSTFADHLAEVLVGAPVVRSDDFRVPWDADPLTWWGPLRAAVLDPLRDGRPAHLRRYDWHHDLYGREEEIPAGPVLIVEGVGAAWAGSPAAFRVWIDAPHDLRRARAIDRDGPEYAGAWDAWSTRETAFFAADGTRARSDLLVDGTTFTSHRFRTYSTASTSADGDPPDSSA